MKSCSMMVSLGLLLATQLQAADEPGMSHDGMLDIRGSLNHAPCVLDMTSAFQTVDLGYVPRSYLQRPGDMAPPIAFQMRFMDCRRIAGGLPDARTSTFVWSPYEPVLSVAFVAPADADKTKQVKVRGVTGMGLRLTDELGRDIRLGAWGVPLFLTNGSDVVTWHVQPTRTSAPLTNGAFSAVADFRLNYD